MAVFCLCPSLPPPLLPSPILFSLLIVSDGRMNACVPPIGGVGCPQQLISRERGDLTDFCSVARRRAGRFSTFHKQGDEEDEGVAVGGPLSVRATPR